MATECINVYYLRMEKNLIRSLFFTFIQGISWRSIQIFQILNPFIHPCILFLTNKLNDFFDRQQEHALISTKKEGECPMYTGCMHRNKPNTPQTKKDHTNKTKQS